MIHLDYSLLVFVVVQVLVWLFVVVLIKVVEFQRPMLLLWMMMTMKHYEMVVENY
jgi:hypothetical protein